MSAPAPRRLWLYAPWALFALVVLGWVGWWHALKGETLRRLDAWFTEQTAAGAEAGYAARTVSGFPLRLAVRLEGVIYAPPDRGYRAALPALVVNVNPVAPNHLILAPTGALQFDTKDGRTRTLTADRALLSVRMRGDALARGSLEFTALRIAEAGRPDTTLASGGGHLRPDPRASGPYQLALELQDWDMGKPVKAFEPYGTVIETLQAEIVLEQAAALIAAPGADPLEAWRAAGGRLVTERAQVVWGPLKLNARGAGGLDAERRLTGELEIDAPDPGPAIGALARSPGLSDDARDAIRVIALAARLRGKALQSTLSARDGVLRLGSAPLRPLPPVY